MYVYVEQENQATEGATQEEDVSGSYQLMQQQLMQANETIAMLMEKNSRVQPTASQLLIVTISYSRGTDIAYLTAISLLGNYLRTAVDDLL